MYVKQTLHLENTSTNIASTVFPDVIESYELSFCLPNFQIFWIVILLIIDNKHILTRLG